jgi:hypothetical protein
MLSERPYPGQLWKHDSMRVIVVAVHPNSVTYAEAPLVACAMQRIYDAAQRAIHHEPRRANLGRKSRMQSLCLSPNED